MLFGPTNEEQITQIFRDSVKSYRDVPKNLYHIQWKFRDEVRPRFGVMRGREFLMKDAYSFDLDAEGARQSYYRMFLAYLRTFARMGLKAVPMKADTGPIGGDLSHEFIILADTGESEVFCDRDLIEMPVPDETTDYGQDLAPVVKRWTGQICCDERNARRKRFEREVPAERRLSARGIEVGHIFYFGTKYTAKMKCQVQGPDGQLVTVHGGSYGVGVSRLVAAIIEASHDSAGIVWPDRRALQDRPYQLEAWRQRPATRLAPSSTRARRRNGATSSTTTRAKAPARSSRPWISSACRGRWLWGRKAWRTAKSS